MIRREVKIRNKLGLHARAAARFVHAAAGFRSKVTVSRGGQTMDGKSILGILLLAASHGSRLALTARGVDEKECIAALAELVETGFGES